MSELSLLFPTPKKDMDDWINLLVGTERLTTSQITKRYIRARAESSTKSQRNRVDLFFELANKHRDTPLLYYLSDYQHLIDKPEVLWAVIRSVLFSLCHPF
jgi:hypothetical protein